LRRREAEEDASLRQDEKGCIKQSERSNKRKDEKECVVF
jgi:hypothetical protein